MPDPLKSAFFWILPWLKVKSCTFEDQALVCECMGVAVLQMLVFKSSSKAMENKTLVSNVFHQKLKPELLQNNYDSNPGLWYTFL